MVVITDMVVVGGSSASWVICASAEHATPGWEHKSVMLCENGAVLFDDMAAAANRST